MNLIKKIFRNLKENFSYYLISTLVSTPFYFFVLITWKFLYGTVPLSVKIGTIFILLGIIISGTKEWEVDLEFAGMLILIFWAVFCVVFIFSILFYVTS